MVEQHKLLIILFCLIGALGLAIIDRDVRVVFSNMASAAVGGYFGATVPGGGVKKQATDSDRHNRGHD